MQIFYCGARFMEKHRAQARVPVRHAEACATMVARLLMINGYDMPRFAALDIGSNSIRMMAAEITPQEPLKTLAAEREVVRLGTSVFREGKLSRSSIDLACDVLNRM